MTSLIFIFVTIMVVSLLGYWILTTTRQEQKLFRPTGQQFNYESGAELAFSEASEFYIASDSIKLQLIGNQYGLACWNLSRYKFEQICAENKIKPDPKHVILRIIEPGANVNNSDIRVKTIAGQYKFRLNPHQSCYITLGIMHHKILIPLLTSETVSL